MSRNYNEGKIYKIEPIIPHDNGDVYIGSTTEKYLCQRFRNHKNDYNKYCNGKPRGRISVFGIFDKYGVENCKIELLENISALSKDELIAREAHHIRSVDCVNIVVPGRTDKEWKEDNIERFKEYNNAYCKNAYIANRESRLEQAKQNYAKNRDIKLKYQKQYNIENKEKIKEKNSNYASANKEKIREYKQEYRLRAEVVRCECGSSIKKHNIIIHQNTKKHQSYINQRDL